MSAIGILAYGSLIDDPGVEIEPYIEARIRDIETPFSIEFARSSATRDGAPTVVPVEDGGAPVKAQILVLKNQIDLGKAEDLLWRRETRNEQTDKHYKKPLNPAPNRMVVEIVNDWQGLKYVLYTKLGANIPDVSADKLSELAIRSARTEAGQEGKDGISYLISTMAHGIVTPLSGDYEKAILMKTKTESLVEALEKLRNE